MLRRSLIIALFVWSIGSVFGQQAKVHLQVVPENSVALLDGDSLGKADQRTVYMGFNQRKGIDTHTVMVASEGYLPFKQSFTATTPRDLGLNIKLQRILPKIEAHVEGRFDWRPVVSGIPYGTELGAGTRWLYRYNKDVLDIKAKDELHLAISLMGLDAFDSLPDAKTLIEQGDSARYMLQGIVESYTLRRGLRSEEYASYYKAYTASVSVRWQLADREKDSLLMDVPHASVYEYRGISTIGFHDAVVDNFMHFVLEDAALSKVFQPTKQQRPIEPIDRFEESEGDSGTVLDQSGKPFLPQDTTLNDRVQPTQVAAPAKPLIQSQVTVNGDSLRSVLSKKDVQNEESHALFSVDVELKPKLLKIKRPFAQATKAYAEAGTVYLLNDANAIIGAGVVVSADGMILAAEIPSADIPVRMRFINGVELFATRIEGVNDYGLARYQIDANSLKGQELNLQAGSSSSRCRLPIPNANDKVGATWSECNFSIEEAPCNELSERLHGLPVYDQQYNWVGLLMVRSDRPTLVDGSTIFNVFGLRYE